MTTEPTDLFLAAWEAGFAGTPLSILRPAKPGDRTPADWEGRREPAANFGDRIPADPSPGAVPPDAVGDRTPAVSSALPFALRPRFGQRTRPKPPPRQRGGQPGNRNRLKHGYRSAAVEGPRRELNAEIRNARRLNAAVDALIAEAKSPAAPPTQPLRVLRQAPPLNILAISRSHFLAGSALRRVLKSRSSPAPAFPFRTRQLDATA